MDKAKKIPYYGSLALLVYMPFHLFLAQWLSTYTNGLEFWKVAKDIGTIILVWASFGLVLYSGAYKKSRLYRNLTTLTFLYLGLHILLYFVNKETTQDVAALATVYNNRLLWYLIIGMSAVMLTPELLQGSRIKRIIVCVSSVVCLVGLLQIVLPDNIMTRFGYSIERGARPAFYIDDKSDLPRIMSTLRDPNSLGAFLVVPILLLVQVLLDKKYKNGHMLFFGLLSLHLLTLFLTFSRAAWVAVSISVFVMIWLQHKSKLKPWLKNNKASVLAAIFALLLFGFLLRDQYVVQNIIFHSDETTTAQRDSNELHLDFARRGLEGIVAQPEGYGPGTAGIVSIHNESVGRLTENYYIQIGYEVGLIGLAIFIFILVVVFKKLSSTDSYKLVLLASGAGYVFMAFIMHLWTNEAVAVYWWLSVGLAIGNMRESSNKRIKAN